MHVYELGEGSNKTGSRGMIPLKIYMPLKWLKMLLKENKNFDFINRKKRNSTYNRN